MVRIAYIPLVVSSGIRRSKPQFVVEDYTTYRFEGKSPYPYATFAQRISVLQDFAETRYPSRQPMFIACALGMVALLAVLAFTIYIGISPTSMCLVIFMPALLAVVFSKVRLSYKHQLVAFEQNLRHLLSRFTAEDANTHNIKWELQDIYYPCLYSSSIYPGHPNCGIVVEIVDLSAAHSVVLVTPPPAYAPQLPVYNDDAEDMAANEKDLPAYERHAVLGEKIV